MNKTLTLWHEIKTESYTTKYYYLDHGIYYFLRVQKVLKPYKEIDAFSDFWCIGLSELTKGQVGIGRSSGIVNFHGKVGFFAPPKSIIEWHVNKGPFIWHGFISASPLIGNLPNSPIIFSYNDFIPLKISELINLMGNIQFLSKADKIEKVSAVAIRTKEYIDSNYKNSCSIEEMSHILNYSHPVMTRLFKQCFALSPIEYRNKLRIFEAQKLFLIEPRNVKETCIKTGFKDSSRFYRQFKKSTNVSPATFAPKN